MGDITKKGLERFELNTASNLRAKLLENLRQNKSKQIIQLNLKKVKKFGMDVPIIIQRMMEWQIKMQNSIIHVLLLMVII